MPINAALPLLASSSFSLFKLVVCLERQAFSLIKVIPAKSVA